MGASETTNLFYDEMAAETSITSKLSTYSSKPAIFTGQYVPENASLPYIHTRGVVSDTPFDTKDMTGREIIRDIGCYAEDTGSDKAIEELAEAVRSFFHRRSFSIGTGMVLCLADGPRIAPTGEGVTGRIVSVRLIYHE